MLVVQPLIQHIAVFAKQIDSADAVFACQHRFNHCSYIFGFVLHHFAHHLMIQIGAVRIDDISALHTQHRTIGIGERLGFKDGGRKIFHRNVGSHHTNKVSFFVVKRHRTSHDGRVDRIARCMRSHPAGCVFRLGNEIPVDRHIRHSLELVGLDDGGVLAQQDFIRLRFWPESVCHVEFSLLRIVVGFESDGTTHNVRIASHHLHGIFHHRIRVIQMLLHVPTHIRRGHIHSVQHVLDVHHLSVQHLLCLCQRFLLNCIVRIAEHDEEGCHKQNGDRQQYPPADTCGERISDILNYSNQGLSGVSE